MLEMLPNTSTVDTVLLTIGFGLGIVVLIMTLAGKGHDDIRPLLASITTVLLAALFALEESYAQAVLALLLAIAIFLSLIERQ